MAKPGVKSGASIAAQTILLASGNANADARGLRAARIEAMAWR